VGANVATNYVYVPSNFSGSTLTRIETSFGAAAATDAAGFRLKSVDSSGTVNTEATWTHTSGNLQHIVTGLSLTALHGKVVYIESASGGTNASGYTASLQWQL
tara:strand:+ start:939 stop:1247 length:309 start_codon:yes stop_codon:yes gene_type:complete